MHMEIQIRNGMRGKIRLMQRACPKFGLYAVDLVFVKFWQISNEVEKNKVYYKYKGVYKLTLILLVITTSEITVINSSYMV